MRYIGKDVEKVDAYVKVSGKAIYQGDVKIDGMLYGAVLRAKYPHAKILSINTSQAESVDGVIKVLTYKDIPAENLFGKAVADQPVLCDDKVRYLGDAVALVIAESKDIAEEAKNYINVEYEVLQPITDVVGNENIAAYNQIKKGNIEKGFEQSDFIIERTYSTQFADCCCMDYEASTSYYDENNILTVLTHSQNVYFDRREICRVLGLEYDQVRVIKTYMGAGFGKREDIYTQIHSALGTYITRRPVKIIFDRAESLLVGTKRHPFYMTYKTGVSKDGKILAQQIRITADTGAYLSWAPNIIRKGSVHACGPYEIPNIDIETKAIFTNNAFSGAFRGFGAPQVTFAYESQMDEIAKEIGIDRIEFRRTNLFKEKSITATGQELVSSVGLNETLDEALKYYNENPLPLPEDPDLKRGMGIGTTFYGIGYGNAIPDIGSAVVELDMDGTITIKIGAIDYGQGSSTVFSQIAAEELNIDIKKVKIITADTHRTPMSGSTVASRQTYVSGNAVYNASQKLMKNILDTAAVILSSDINNLEINNEIIVDKTDNSKRITYEKIAKIGFEKRKPLASQARFKAKTTEIDAEKGRGNVYWPYAFATQIAEVDVDSQTGTVYVRRVIAAHDVGKALSPSMIKSQIYGGVVMGMGWALLEDYKVEQAIPQTLGFERYILVGSKDSPEIVPIIVESEEPTGPYGAKGVGEPVMVPTAPAIANAITDAVGKRVYSLPIIPEKIIGLEK